MVVKKLTTVFILLQAGLNVSKEVIFAIFNLLITLPESGVHKCGAT